MIPGGKIMGPTPNLVNPSTVVAERVANIAAPASSNTVWDKLSQRPELATQPLMSGGMSTSTPGSYGTSKLQHLSTQLTAGQDRYKNPLPHLQGKPKPGIGTAMQEVAGGSGMGAQKGNTVFVDDANWKVTLKEIIGSRMLTPEQLEKASIQNVKKLFNVGLNTGRHQGSASVGTAQENEELYYMFQRMMLEGFVRGVDISKDIAKRGGLNIAIRNVSFNENAKNNIGLHSSSKNGSSINFNAGHWRRMTDIEKYTLFMHEVGHGLMRRPELPASDKYDIMGDGPYGVAKRLMSSKETYNAILNDHFGSANNKGTIAISKIEKGKGTTDFDPSWFPQLSGEQVKVGGGYDPNTGGTTTPPAGPDYTKNFDALNSSFAKLTDMLTAQQGQMNDMMQQQEINSIMQSGPDVQNSPMQVAAGGQPTMGTGGGAMGALGGSYDLTGFAQQLANIEGGSSGNAGNLLSSG